MNKKLCLIPLALLLSNIFLQNQVKSSNRQGEEIKFKRSIEFIYKPTSSSHSLKIGNTQLCKEKTFGELIQNCVKSHKNSKFEKVIADIIDELSDILAKGHDDICRKGFYSKPMTKHCY